MTRIGCVGLVVVGLLLAVGCQQQGADRPATFGVTGKVTLDGTPVDGAVVTFAPSGSSGTAAVGKTDASGNYSLMSFGAQEGAIPGQYAVTITKYKADAAAAGGGSDTAEMPADYSGAAPESEQAGPENELPAIYASPASSGLKATVTENASENVFDFPLTSSGGGAGSSP